MTAAVGTERSGRSEQAAPEAEAGRMSVGTIHPLKSGGVLVDVGDDFPAWRPDAGAARRLLLERDLLRHHHGFPAVAPAAPGMPACPGGPAAESAPVGSAVT